MNVLLDGLLTEWPWDPLTIGLSVGLLCVVGTRLYEPWLRRHLLYAVTNKRHVILSGKLRPDLRSSDLGWLPALDLQQKGRDRGTISIDADEPTAGWRILPQHSKSELSDGFRFCRIENPTAVYGLICRASRDRCLELHRGPATDFIG